MKISVICPVYNEAAHIEQVIRFFENAGTMSRELILVDGGSTDDTLLILNKVTFNNPLIRILHNPDKYVPFALNKAIQEAKGEYICRIDAHTHYPSDYLQKCLDTIEKTGADNVGGYISTIGISDKGLAIAHAMSTIFGVGNTEFRTRIIDEYVDSVPFGFWKREAFEKFGLFDTDLLRNQDDEFNYRINKKGGKVFQSSYIHSQYFIREDFKALFTQYFGYGYYKPLVFKKLNYFGLRFRHIIPSLFVLYLFSIPMVLINWLWFIPFALYIFIAIFFSLVSRYSLKIKFYTLLAYIIIHFSYGVGFLAGLFKWAKS